MIPLKDDIRSQSLPIVTWFLIAINGLAFFYVTFLPGEEQVIFLASMGLKPTMLSVAQPAQFLTLFTHMFMHGGWGHLLSNMWVLFIFGNNVEDLMGSGRYLVFYILGGLTAAVLQMFFSSRGFTVMVGASGAIAAVMGAYFVYYPRARVLTFIPLPIFGWIVRLPAVIFLGLWFLMQLLYGFMAAVSGSMGGVGWWAHIGGFVFGRVLARPLAQEGPGYYSDNL